MRERVLGSGIGDETATGHFPHVEHVVVASAGQETTVGRPREAAHLLRVAGQFANPAQTHANERNS